VNELLPPGTPPRYRVLVRLACFVLLSLGLGGAAGVVWESVVKLPTYIVGSDGGASTTERGLTEFVAGDAWFCLIGLVLFTALGILAWRWFSTIGWGLVLVVVLTAVASALVCWAVGYHLGPGEFAPPTGRGPAGRRGPDRAHPARPRLAADLAVLRGHPGAAGVVARSRRRGAEAVLPPPGDGRLSGRAAGELRARSPPR
jgi:hypothetical protein